MSPASTSSNMIVKTIRRSLVDFWCPHPRTTITSPPAFLLPFRAHMSSISTSDPSATESNLSPPPPPPPPSQAPVAAATTSTTSPTPPTTTKYIATPTPPPTPTEPLHIPPTLPLLLAQPAPYYATIHIHERPFLLTPGDTLRLPFLLKHVLPGDILRLNRATTLGSRDYTLKGHPYVDDRLFECRARVLGTESEPMRMKEKTKRRQRRVKTVKSKHKYTILRVMGIRIKGMEELEAEGGTGVNMEMETETPQA
ncbi:MAG: hypothetical protein M1834_004924 [Cirrosporium novae-zelandiae]|nr:MAG: hypothetical protein M1834_004924 [Cirrosporium novae-zelandiae]